MSYKLERYSLPQLKDLASKMDLPMRRSRVEMIKDISDGFREYEEYKKDKLDRYTRYEQLGEKGKEGVTYLVRDKNGNEYAMKTFRKEKSSLTLKREYSLQKKASMVGVAPKVYNYDTVSKYIVMERMDRHLLDDIRKKGYLTKKQQERILEIFSKLDQVGVFHGDANILNYMVKDKEIYMIDFGFSKEITRVFINKLETDKPNFHLMTIGFILKLKEIGMSDISYKYMLKCLPVEYLRKYKL
jgi:predicted Ser/Thr protein kinase